MNKNYLNINVYEATLQRIEYIFKEFDNINISISGGKDSGVVTNIIIDYIRNHNCKNNVSITFIDLEAEYNNTISFLKDIFENNKDIMTPYWICLPMLTTNSVSMYEPYWIFWDKDKKEKWVREMPSMKYVINEHNNIFPFFYDKMTFEEFVVLFHKWLSKKNNNEKVANILGIRANESLNRLNAITTDNKERYKDCHYSTKVDDNCFTFYPIYDWKVEDIWTYNSKFKKPYNKTYDMFYLAGVSLPKMRICEPYGMEQKAGLHLYKVIEPETWGRVVNRVSGGNFGNIYHHSKALGLKDIKIPKNHTWRSYCKFLLNTLPYNTRKEYMTKFVKFIKYWHYKGCGLDDETIEKLAPFKQHFIITNDISNRGKRDKKLVMFKSIPDEMGTLDIKTDMLTWRRMCYAIIKNDIICESLSFKLNKGQKEILNNTMQKYNRL